MNSGPLNPRTRRAALALAATGLLILAGYLGIRWHRASHPAEPFRILLVTERPPATAALSHNQARAQEQFVPPPPAAFWELVEIMGLRLDNVRIPEAIVRGHKLAVAFPGCASVWFTLGNLLNRSLLDDPIASTATEQAQAEAAFQRGLDLIPGHSRGTFRMAVFRATSGAHREALDLLLNARAKHPQDPLLLLGIANAARSAGLLDLAARAAERHEYLTLPEFQPQSFQLLHLYRGNFERFEARLQASPGQLRYSIAQFYRGYLALLAGDRAGARGHFAVCEAITSGIPNYIRLAAVFRMEIDGQHAEARESLAALERERVGLRVSDGEFTHRMAETAAFLEDRTLAVELAERAYTQGFGCTRWYEHSPLLASIRDTARYRALLQHLKERQAMLESRFPPKRFGL